LPVDLNRDDLVKTRLKANFSGLGHLWLPQTVLASDFIVSMPKVKTHHWTGVTLSMKNMFGIVPGSRYGWPKNVLHWAGIHETVLDICATIRPHFVIADAIVAMGGDGPLKGQACQLDTVVLSDDPVAADSLCIDLLKVDPNRIAHTLRCASAMMIQIKPALAQKSSVFRARRQGMRPGEIFALRRGRVTTTNADVYERVNRGDLDTPKTTKSVRLAALSSGLARDLEDWLKASPDGGPDGWLFPSEKLSTPVRKDGVWRRKVRPKLIEAGLDWVNFQVLRRTHSSIMREEKVDPKVVADQLGHLSM